MTYQPPPPGSRPGGVPPPNVRYRVPTSGQPGPPIPPRQRPPSRSPVIAPVLALLGLIIIGGASVWGISLLGIDVAEPESDRTAITEPDRTSAPRSDSGDTSSAPGSGVGSGTLASNTSIGQIDPRDFLPEATVEDGEEGLALSTQLARPPEGRRPDVKGTILFARDADIWAASGQDIRQLTNSRQDSHPTWSHNGRHVYFIRTQKRATTKARLPGKYTFYLNDVMRMNANGGDKKRIHKALIEQPGALWFSHVLQPDVSPDGKTIALVSDGADGNGPVTLHTLPAKPESRLRGTKPRSVGDLGHNDPEWSPDGRRIAFTQNHAQGTTGRPAVVIYTCKTRKNCQQGSAKPLKFNYANPSWSRDGDWLAVEKITPAGRDIAIINARKGDELARLTRDGDSFAPVVSPDGDQIAYLHRDGVNIDVRIMTLDTTRKNDITLIDDQAITNDGGIDAGSSPAWFIPDSELTPRVERVDATEGVPQDVATATDDQVLGAVAP